MNGSQLRSYFKQIRATHKRGSLDLRNCYFVATNGSDSANGSEDAPFATVAKALTTMTAGGTVYVRAGTYTEYLNISKACAIKAWFGESVTFRPATNGTSAAVLISTSNVTLDGLVIDAVNRKRGIDISTAANVIIRNGEVKNCYGVGEGQYGQGIVVSQDETCRDILIADMLIYNVGSSASDTLAKCHGIYAACPGMRISGTEIHTVDSHGVHWYGSQGGDLILDNCYIHDVRVGAGFYNSSVVAYNNVIRDVLSAFWNRDNIVSVLAAYNTCTGFSNAVDISTLGNRTPAVSVRYVNNIFHDGTKLLQAEQVTSTTAVVEMSHNLRSEVTGDDYMGTNQGQYTSAYEVEHINATFDPITDDNAAGINPTTGNPAIAAGTWVTDLYSDRGGYLRSGVPTLGAWE